MAVNLEINKVIREDTSFSTDLYGESALSAVLQEFLGQAHYDLSRVIKTKVGRIQIIHF